MVRVYVIHFLSSKLEMKDVYAMCVVIVCMTVVEVKNGAVYVPLSYASSIWLVGGLG